MIARCKTPLCLDGRMLGEAGTGVATYARTLRAALSLLAEDPPLVLTDRQGTGITSRARHRPRLERWWRWLATRQDRPVDARKDGEGLVGRDLFRLAQRHFREHGTALRVRAGGEPAGIMHWTYPVPIVLEGWSNLYTIHDAIPFTHPALTPIDPERHRRLLGVIAEEAAAVLTVSADAAAGLRASGAVDPALVVNCGQAVLPAPMPGPLPAGLQVRGYFLVCGAVEPRKNIANLVAAWRASGTALPLVVAGPDGWQAQELAPLLGGEGIMRLPYLPAPVLSGLQSAAKALLFPSLAEGFGLPIVEAMALGTPVMTGAGGATAEVAADAALLVDPADVGAIAAGIARLDRDEGLRAQMVVRGRRRAAEFSLERFAERLQQVHRAVIVNGGAPLYRSREA